MPLDHDGMQAVISVGQTSPDGVRLEGRPSALLFGGPRSLPESKEGTWLHEPALDTDDLRGARVKSTPSPRANYLDDLRCETPTPSQMQQANVTGHDTSALGGNDNLPYPLKSNQPRGDIIELLQIKTTGVAATVKLANQLAKQVSQAPQVSQASSQETDKPESAYDPYIGPDEWICRLLVNPNRKILVDSQTQLIQQVLADKSGLTLRLKGHESWPLRFTKDIKVSDNYKVYGVSSDMTTNDIADAILAKHQTLKNIQVTKITETI
ncbi:hypothetical protein DFS34DRAFT_447260 [Phlyctochytrium arcticum]|nr:hypothetical protein DFS34DRAFT_500705 [Phlyctochytrium arcticum]KAI9088501.1 hypothetical protein DFS34DRAFT_447260 [Phlyctochytrium arcticum]